MKRPIGYRGVGRALGVAESTVRGWAAAGAPIAAGVANDLAEIRAWLAVYGPPLRVGGPRAPREPNHWQICRRCGAVGKASGSRRVAESVVATYRCSACDPAEVWKVVFRPKVFVART